MRFVALFLAVALAGPVFADEDDDDRRPRRPALVEVVNEFPVPVEVQEPLEVRVQEPLQVEVTNLPPPLPDVLPVEIVNQGDGESSVVRDGRLSTSLPAKFRS